MAPRKGAGENSKKAAGNAKKAEAAAAKQAEQQKKVADAEDREWAKGAKTNAKADAAAAKQADAARKKAERDALLAAEEASQPSKGKAAGASKGAQKKARGIDSALGSLDATGSQKATALNASGIDNALDALSLTGGAADKIDRHPERRFKTAYAAFEERRLEEMKDEKGLRRQQKIDAIRKEFDKHPDNPFNQVSGKFNSTREELREMGESERRKVEDRLTGPGGNAAS